MACFGILTLHKPGGRPHFFPLLPPIPPLAFIAWRCWEEIWEARQLFKVSYHLTLENKFVFFHISSLAKKATWPLRYFSTEHHLLEQMLLWQQTSIMDCCHSTRAENLVCLLYQAWKHGLSSVLVSDSNTLTCFQLRSFLNLFDIHPLQLQFSLRIPLI